MKHVFYKSCAELYIWLCAADMIKINSSALVTGLTSVRSGYTTDTLIALGTERSNK